MFLVKQLEKEQASLTNEEYQDDMHDQLRDGDDVIEQKSKKFKSSY